MCYRPLTISDMSEAQTTATAASVPGQKTCGNTPVGVVNYLTGKPYCTNIVLIHLKFLPNLAMCSSDASGLTIGSTVSIAEVTSQLEQAETAVFQKNAEHIKRVASVLILSVAS